MTKLFTLQVARGVAANLVVFSHLFVVEGKYTGGGVLPSFTLYGMAGVDLFFVLSGFIMVAVAGRGIGPLQFLWRRAARNIPYLLVSIAGGVRRATADLDRPCARRPQHVCGSGRRNGIPSRTKKLEWRKWRVV